MKQSRGRPRRVANPCKRQRCNRRAIATGLCLTHSRAEADRLFSLIIRARDKRCQRCGTVQNLECSHHITRGRFAIRFDEGNAVAHCSGCHVYFTNHPAIHTEWIREYMGADAYDALMDRAYGPKDAGGRRWLTDVERVDYAATIGVLRDRAKQLGVAA